MDVTARLISTRAPKNPEGLVLVLHGGASRRDRPEVSPTQLSVLRMIPIAQRIARAGRGRLAVVRLLNSVRGWDTRHTPVEDVRWALDQLRSEYDGLPTCLVGHSLGGRAALLAGDQPEVIQRRGAEPVGDPARTGSTSPAGRRSWCTGPTTGSPTPAARPRMTKALARTTAAGYLRVTGGKHAMLSHRSVFEGAATDFVRATLLGADVTVRSPTCSTARREVTV